MARKSILTATERESLIPFPESVEICNQLYEFSREDRALILSKRTEPNRLGFAVHLCLLRYPGTDLCYGFSAQTPIVRWVANELNMLPRNWNSYADREETRREHIRELRDYLGLKSFGSSESEHLCKALIERAMQCDPGALLAEYAVGFLFQNRIVIPSVATIEELCATALTESDRRIFVLLTESLTDRQKELMDRLLQRALNQFQTGLTKIRTPITKSRVSDINRQIERLQQIRSFAIPANVAVKIHRNRLRKIARETNRIDPNDLGKLDPVRRYGMITALLLDLQESVTDELLEQHDKIMGRFFSRTENQFKNDLFTNSKQLIKAAQLGIKLIKALWEAKQSNGNIADAIVEAASWDEIEKTAKDTTVENFSESAVKLMNEKHKTLRK